jgi:hypothetical protein
LVERRQRQRFEQTGISTDGYELNGGAITALRQAIAEAEKQEQKTPLKVLGLTVFTENRLRNGRVYDVETLQAMTNRDILAIPGMGKKALKEVLEALDVYAIDISQKRVDETAKDRHEPESNNVEIAAEQSDNYAAFLAGVRFARVNLPAPSKEWVGLTDEEVNVIIDKEIGFNSCWGPEEKFARAIEAKLKEKNGG